MAKKKEEIVKIPKSERGKLSAYDVKKEEIVKIPESERGKLSAYDVKVVRETPPIFPFSGWTPEDIIAAIQSHDQGQFFLSELLYHAMRKETRIGSALEKRVNMIRNFPFSMQVPEQTPERIKRKTIQLEKNFDQIFPKHALTEILRRVIMFGFCIARHSFKMIEDQVVPLIVPWTHSSCYYNVIEKQFRVRTEDGLDIAVVGDPWIIFSLGGDRPWLNGAMRQLAFPFNLINLGFDRWMNFNDVEATAIRHISGPRPTREQKETGSFVRQTEQARGGDTIYSPENYTFELVTSGGRSSAYKTFETLIQMAHNEISIILTGNNLTQEIKGGSLAASNTASQGLLEASQSDVEFLQSPIYEHTSRLWIEKNFTPFVYGETSLTQYRWKPCWGVNDVLDKLEDSESSQKYAQAVTSFLNSAMQANVASQLNIDWEETAKRCGVILHTNRMNGVENE